MSGIKRIAILAVLAIGTYILMSSIYTVSEVEQAIITQFAKPIGAPVTDAGLKFKIPFIQDVNLIDKRVLEWDGNPSDMPTKDKLYVSVDLFARWRIVDPLQYFLRLHDERSAQSRLDDVLGSETLTRSPNTNYRDHPHHQGTCAAARHPHDQRGTTIGCGVTGADPEGTQTGRAGDLCRSCGKGSSVWYRVARYPVQADQLQ